MKLDVENNGYIIIPARNEADCIGPVLRGIIHLNFIEKNRIIVADNGSTDTTSSIASLMGISTVYETNLGYGSACLAALREIKKYDLNPEWVMICDGDGSDDPKDMPMLYQIFLTEAADLVIGSRTIGLVEEGSLGFIQRYGNWLTCFLILIFYRRKFTDLGPLRIIRYSAFEKMNLKDKTWGWNIEMQIRAMQENLRIVEVPVNYRRRMFGISKISGTISMTVRVGIKILFTFFKLTFFTVVNR